MNRKELLHSASTLKLITFDVDGVLTNGSLILGEKGDEYKVFNAHDGLGLVMLRKAGLNIAVISARSSSIVEERMAALGIHYVYQGQSNKLDTLIELMKKLEIEKSQVAFVGDDLVDLKAMSMAGLAITVPAAPNLVKQKADWVTSKEGGKGAVREVCELVLEAQNKLESAYQDYI
jgi:3-deoxy-D-manno-octulosonate 8-phosphate phosphatase (KDO 8-P phosphatase)